MSATAVVAEAAPARRVGRTRLVVRRWGIVVGVCILAAMVVLSFTASSIVGISGEEISDDQVLTAPSAEHPFGTDDLGRDVFVRVFEAVRIDYLIGAVGVAFAVVVGSALGIAVGIASRRIWGVMMMRVTDALIAVPFPLAMILIVVSVGDAATPFGLPPGVMPMMIAIFLVGWTIYARLSRAETLSLRDRDFVTAARLMGFSTTRIVFRHVLPTVIRSTGTYAVTDFILVIGFVAALPFFGAGIAPPTPEWGAMMYDGRASMATAWWVVVFPGLGLVVTAVAVALIAEALLGGRSRARRRRT